MKLSKLSTLAVLVTLVTIAASIFGPVGLDSAQATQNTVPLGSTATFAILAGTSITNTGATIVNGDLGVSPGATVTGFDGVPDGTVNGTMHVNDVAAGTAQGDLTIAYENAAGRSAATVDTQLGGTTKYTGVYDTAAGTLQITGNLTLDAQGDPDAVFIFKAGSTLITADGSRVILINNAQASKVFWQVTSSATLGADSVFQGNILALTSITVGNNATVTGRLLARNGTVSLDANTVTLPPAAPTVVSAATNASGSTISITFSKAMVDPSGEQAQFKYQIGGGANQSFSAAALHSGNATMIDLTTSVITIAYGNTITVSYTAGTVAAADGGVLSSFSGQAVTNNVPAYYTLTAPADFTLTLDPAQATSSSNKTLSVATNDGTMTSVIINVKGTSGQTGKLKSSGAISLSMALSLAGTGLTTRILSDSNQTLISPATLTEVDPEMVWSVSDLVITQPAFDAVPAGSYTITITFTATFSS